MGFKQTIRYSSHPAARVMRGAYYFSDRVSIPAPHIIVLPLRIAYETARSVIHFLRRVLIAEPLFKSYCHSYGKNLHTDIFVPWVQGKGKIILGDDVLIGGKASFSFASRYTLDPIFEMGDHSGIGNGCSIRVGKSITIGSHCRIASGVSIFDVPGHPIDPVTRMEGAAALDEEVRPVRIGNNVWIGANSIIFPGVTIGDNSVIAMGSSVMTNVPPDTVVGGNPARSMKSLAKGANA